MDFDGETTLICEYRKRTTMADLMPMSLIILRGGHRITLFESFEKVGKGQVTITDEGVRLTVMIEGDVDVKINNVDCQGFGELGPDDTLSIGAAVFSFV